MIAFLIGVFVFWLIWRWLSRPTHVVEIAPPAPMAVTVLTPTRSFYDRNGSFAGSSVTHGNSTSVYDRNGRFDGSAIRGGRAGNERPRAVSDNL
jgi:hypothetical protein